MDYHYLTPAQFDALAAQDAFLEWAEFAGNRYGTPWTSVAKAMAAGKTVVLEIEVQGAAQVRQRFADALLLFIVPPTREVLLERLRHRGTDDDERIGRRMALAEAELEEADKFDHVVVNDTVDGAVTEIARILGR